MKRIPNGTRPTRRAPTDWFTGDVWHDPVIEAPEPAALRSLVVHFSPGARTNWHTHPRGQTLYVLSGQGLVCRRGGTPETINPGDTIWFDANEEHWHGAAPGNSMTHIAMQEADESGSVANWLEPVSDEDYSG